MTVVLTASSIFGTLFEAIRQPTLNGYLLAGSLIGPEGLALVKELVQVESLAQVQHHQAPHAFMLCRVHVPSAYVCCQELGSDGCGSEFLDPKNTSRRKITKRSVCQQQSSQASMLKSFCCIQSQNLTVSVSMHALAAALLLGCGPEHDLSHCNTVMFHVLTAVHT